MNSWLRSRFGSCWGQGASRREAQSNNPCNFHEQHNHRSMNLIFYFYLCLSTSLSWLSYSALLVRGAKRGRTIYLGALRRELSQASPAWAKPQAPGCPGGYLGYCALFSFAEQSTREAPSIRSLVRLRRTIHSEPEYYVILLYLVWIPRKLRLCKEKTRKCKEFLKINFLIFGPGFARQDSFNPIAFARRTLFEFQIICSAGREQKMLVHLRGA